MRFFDAHHIVEIGQRFQRGGRRSRVAPNGGGGQRHRAKGKARIPRRTCRKNKRSHGLGWHQPARSNPSRSGQPDNTGRRINLCQFNNRCFKGYSLKVYAQLLRSRHYPVEMGVHQEGDAVKSGQGFKHAIPEQEPAIGKGKPRVLLLNQLAIIPEHYLLTFW